MGMWEEVELIPGSKVAAPTEVDTQRRGMSHSCHGTFLKTVFYMFLCIRCNIED